MTAPGNSSSKPSKGWPPVSESPGPPVVFIAQLGTGGDAWQPVIDRLASGTMTVTYDRPGTGKRRPRPAPNPPLPHSANADDLASILHKQGITEPAVLVGHSIGSLIARVFADRYPNRVAGMIHVDGSIPRGSFGYGPDPMVGAFDGDGPGATQVDLFASEIEVVNAAVPDVPTTVITRTPGRWIPGWHDLDPLWTAYQRQLARQCGVPLVVAADSGHQIPDDAPQLVAHVVDEVVAAVRAGTSVMFDLSTLAVSGGSLTTP